LIDECRMIINPDFRNDNPRFKSINEKPGLKLINSKTFKPGSVILYYISGIKQVDDI
jgi:hypothetical protein